MGLPLPESGLLHQRSMNTLEKHLTTDKNWLHWLQGIKLQLNYDQKLAYEIILTSFSSQSGKIFFLDAPSGAGNTFLINLLLAKV